MTMKSTSEADLTMKVGPDVPDAARRPLVADVAHFRDVGGGSYVLYTEGAHVPPAHAERPVVEAVQVDGIWHPVVEGQKAPRRRKPRVG